MIELLMESLQCGQESQVLSLKCLICTVSKLWLEGHRGNSTCAAQGLWEDSEEGRQAVCAAWDESLLGAGSRSGLSSHTAQFWAWFIYITAAGLSLCPEPQGANGVLRLCCWERPCAPEGQQGQLEWPSGPRVGSCRHSCLCSHLACARGSCSQSCCQLGWYLYSSTVVVMYKERLTNTSNCCPWPSFSGKH